MIHWVIRYLKVPPYLGEFVWILPSSFGFAVGLPGLRKTGEHNILERERLEDIPRFGLAQSINVRERHC